MKQVLLVLLDFISFGILPLLRWVMSRKKKTSIDIDINRDGITDVRISFPTDKEE